MIPAHREWVYTRRRDALPLPPPSSSPSPSPSFSLWRVACGQADAWLCLQIIEEHRTPGSSHSSFLFLFGNESLLLPASPPLPPLLPPLHLNLFFFSFFSLQLHQCALTCTFPIGWLVGVLKAPQLACATTPCTTFCPSFFVFQLRLWVFFSSADLEHFLSPFFAPVPPPLLLLRW